MLVTCALLSEKIKKLQDI